MSTTAVLVPLYKANMTSLEEFSFKRTLMILAAHDIYVIGPRCLSGYFAQLKLTTDSQLKVKVFDDSFFESVNGYNTLLMSGSFYRAFADYKYILIAQTDALIISDGLGDWCSRGYSYVGAPWFRGFHIPHRPLSFLGVGNGGLSLRNVADCIKALSRPMYVPNFTHLDNAPATSAGVRIAKIIKHRVVFAYNFAPLMPRVYEDLFWGMLVSRSCDFFTVPTPEEATQFAYEVAPEYLYDLTERKLPLGCHAWARYNPEFWRSVLGEIGIDLPKLS